MARATKSRSAACWLLLAALAIPGAPAARAAETPAVEEYVLSLPGAQRLGQDGTAPLERRSRSTGPIGVSGEAESGRAPLAAFGAGIASLPGLVLLIGLGTAAWLALRRPEKR